jgi:uncharacterized protein (DUF362 family)
MTMNPRTVAVIKQELAAYPRSSEMNPPSRYPETPIRSEPDPSNHVYASVRRLFCLLEYDRDNYGRPAWNPLGWLVKPGDTVFIKPNMIAHKHARSDDWDYVITHGSIIRAVVDYVYVALRGEGRIILGDAPQTDSRFDLIVARMGLRTLQNLYRERLSFDLEVVDLRDEYWVEKDGIYVQTVKLPGDPRGSLSVDLAEDSMFAEIDAPGKRYYGAFYDTDETNLHHHQGKHEYAISKSPIAADVFINLPKLKTHKKCGLTVSLKSLVGINANKNWLPHYVYGSPRHGGDQFPDATIKNRLENTMVRAAKRMLLTGQPLVLNLARRTKGAAYRIFGDTERLVRSGNWHGNDTVWRMSMDLNRILFYANADGTMRHAREAKRYFSLVDGIVAMEGNGPVAGSRKPAGALIGGSNPVSVDAVCARLMGFDIRKIPLIRRAFDPHPYPLVNHALDEIQARSNAPAWDKPLADWDNDDSLHFKPHFGWTGHIEMDHDLVRL